MTKKMQQNIRILATILVVILLFSTCRKKDDATPYAPYHAKISSNLYPYLFDNGSYWIYKDSLTNNLDSTIITGISKKSYFVSPSGPGEGSPGNFEYFEIEYFSYPSNSTYSEEVIANMISRGLISGGFTYFSKKTIGDSLQNAKIENILDTLTVHGQLYHNVIKMRIQADSYISQNYNFYYVDSVGIIKKELRTGETITNTWNLLRYSTAIKAY